MGQLVDLITAPEDHVDLSKFSLEKYTFSLGVFFSFLLLTLIGQTRVHRAIQDGVL